MKLVCVTDDLGNITCTKGDTSCTINEKEFLKIDEEVTNEILLNFQYAIGLIKLAILRGFITKGEVIKKL